jgi:hypothetical protein
MNSEMINPWAQAEAVPQSPKKLVAHRQKTRKANQPENRDLFIVVPLSGR